MTPLSQLFWRCIHRIDRSLNESVEYSLPHLPILGFIGFTGFPLYYWIWGDLFPQPYENLSLRLIGSVLFFGLLVINYWPTKAKRLLKFYWAITFLYSLSFFFTFMLLKNEGNFVWAMSMMAGLTLLILVAYDWVLVTGLFVIGSVIAVVAYIVTSQHAIDMSRYWMQIPIYSFLVVVGSAFNYKSSSTRQEKLKMLASVGAEITHELRTPLLSIEYNSKKIEEILKKNVQQKTSIDGKQEDLQSAYQNILNETVYANTIIDMLLMNLGGNKINDEKFACHSMREIAIAAVKRYPFRSIQEKSKVKIQEDDDFQIWGSDILIVHVLFNLIKNALIHTDKEDIILINFHSDKNFNHLVFKDTGKGIPANKIAYIFDDFYTSSELGAGTGIGLTFCKKVMKHLEGKIECYSVFGEYTQFTLSFPVVRDAKAQPKISTQAVNKIPSKQSVESHLRGQSILLIDDEDIHHILFNEALSVYNTDIAHAYSASAALALLEEKRFDCIVVDIHMPVMNGLELTQAIRSGNHFTHFADQASIPIIGLSSDPSAQVEKNAYLMGMNAFLRKPIDKSELINSLLEHIADMSNRVLDKQNSELDKLPEDGALYQLGAKLVHNMNTPIITVNMCNKVFKQSFPILFQDSTDSTLLHNIAEDDLGQFVQAPQYYAETMTTMRERLDHFWLEFHQSNLSSGTDLLKSTVEELEKQWQQLDSFNQLILKNLLPKLIEAYQQTKGAQANIADTHISIDQVFTVAENCCGICEHAQQSLVKIHQEL